MVYAIVDRLTEGSDVVKSITSRYRIPICECSICGETNSSRCS